MKSDDISRKNMKEPSAGEDTVITDPKSLVLSERKKHSPLVLKYSDKFFNEEPSEESKQFLDHESEFLNQETDDISDLESEECLNRESTEFLDHESEFFDKESEQFSDDESDNSPTYLEWDNTTDSSQDCGEESTNSIESDRQEDPKDTDMVLVCETKSNARFHCELCKLTFNNEIETGEHLLVHNSCKKCEICNNIMDKNSYIIHMESHKESYKQRIAKYKTQCKKCGKTISKSYLKFHMLQHGSHEDKLGRMKQCPICDKSVVYHYYNDHIKRMHLKRQENTDTLVEKVEKCPVCDLSIKESKIKNHIASHGKSKSGPYVCEQCGKILKHSSAFQTHLLTHTGNLAYKCEFCPYRGLHLGLLKVHVRTHTKDYPYECLVCKKKFITKSNLSKHELSHKPPEFSCSKCEKIYSNKRSLDRHINVIHLNTGYHVECDVCGKKYGTRNYLKAHQKKVHRMQPQSHSYKGRIANYLKAELNIKD